MGKNIFIIIFMMFFLFACNNPEANIEEKQKTPFIVTTRTLQDFHNEISQTKDTIIQASSTLDIIAETSGKISKIFIKEGDSVSVGKSLMYITDNQNNFDILVKQAQNNIELQDANARTQITNIENNIASAEIQYKKALENYHQFLEKNNLKYDNLIKENKNTLKIYNENYKNFLTSLEGSISNYLYESDKIIGITSENEYGNNSWEAYLGAQSGVGLGGVQNEWNRLYSIRGEIRKKIEKSENFPGENAQSDIDFLSHAFEGQRMFVDSMTEMLRGSVVGAGLSMEMKTAWLNQWNSIRNTIQASEGNFITWKNQTKIFLENYETNELATKIASNSLNNPISSKDFNMLQKNKELKLAYDNISLSIQEAFKNAELTLEQAKISLENAKKLKSTTINQLAASKKNAQLGLLQAERNAEKLHIKSPISGTITKIHAEIGEHISAGKILAEISGKNAQAKVEIHPKIVSLLEVGQNIEAQVGTEKIEGQISSLARVPGKNMLSSIKIIFKDANHLIGQPATILFKINKNNENSFLIPISAVKIIAEGEGEVQILKNDNIISEKIQLGSMYGNFIEVFTELDKNSKIITSDVSRFNSNNHIIKHEK